MFCIVHKINLVILFTNYIYIYIIYFKTLQPEFYKKTSLFTTTFAICILPTLPYSRIERTKLENIEIFFFNSKSIFSNRSPIKAANKRDEFGIDVKQKNIFNDKRNQYY